MQALTRSHGPEEEAIQTLRMPTSIRVKKEENSREEKRFVLKRR